MKTRRLIPVLAIATLAVALVSLLPACKPSVAEPAPANEEPSVSGDSIRFPVSSPVLKRLVTAPVMAPQQRVLELPGRIAWDEDHTSRLMPPVAGRFAEATAAGALGATVNADDTLAFLVSPDIGTAQTEYAAAQAALVQAQKNRERLKQLVEINGVSAKDVEQGEADLQRARAEAERTALRLKALGAANAVDARFAIRSPIAGVVVERNTNPGMEWRPDQPGAAMFVVSDPTWLWCWIDAPESALGMLHTGTEVTLHSSAWPNENFPADVDYIGDALDSVSHTVKVRARLRNPERHLKGEMYVTAQLANLTPGALDVPAKAVFLNNNIQQVFVKTADGQFTRKVIEPVATSDQWVSIAGGLNPGDEVVVDGNLYLQKLMQDSAAPVTSSTAAADKPAG